MGQKGAVAGALGPVGEEAGGAGVLGGAMMFQTDAAHLVGQGEEELIVVEVTGAEQAVGLLDHVLVELQLLFGGGETLLLVGEEVQVDP